MHLQIARREAANAENGLSASRQGSDPRGCPQISVWKGLMLLSAEREGGNVRIRLFCLTFRAASCMIYKERIT